MKRIARFLLSCFLCVGTALGVAACGSASAADNEQESPVTGETDILVAYFSWSGNTRQVARRIADDTGADIFRILPEVPYTEEDVFDRAQEELNSGTRPPLADHIDGETMAGYDTVFLGFPIWWYDLPMPVWTFLEEYDFSGKTIIPFFTHNGSSGGAGSLSTLSELCPDADVRTADAFSYRGSSAAESGEAVDEWLSELGYMN